MNNDKRKQLQKIIDKLTDIKAEVEELKDDEENKKDNLPESFQNGEKGELMDAAIDNMGNAVDNIETAISDLESSIE